MTYDAGKPEDWGPLISWGSAAVPATWDAGALRARPERFRTRHGTAELAWLYSNGAMRPFAAWGATLADGRSAHCRWGEWWWRRRSDDGRGWFPGRVKVFADRVAFIDADDYETPNFGDDEPLAADLAKSATFLARLRDDAFAWRFYYYGDTWAREGTGEADPHGSNRGVASMVARLRGVGESYLDFYLGESGAGSELCAEEEVVAVMRALGWRPATDEEVEIGYVRQRSGPLLAGSEADAPADRTEFRTRRGQAELAWVRRAAVLQPVAVWWASLADGRWAHARRGTVCWRRRADHGRGWVPGQIEIMADRVMFTDLGHFLLPSQITGPFAAALAASPSFLDRLREDAFSARFHVLCGEMAWTDGSTTVSLGEDESAAMIAALRGVGETPTDFADENWFYVAQAQPCCDDEVLAALRALGWDKAARTEEEE